MLDYCDTITIMQSKPYSIKEVTSPLERKAAYELRHMVFVAEQGISAEIELDELDQGALHAIVTSSGTIIGTGRLITVSKTTGSIGRMAVDPSFRRQGIGSLILGFLEHKARKTNLQEIVLHAQEYVKEFYSYLGYHQEGRPFDEVGIPHCIMKKTL